MKKTIKRILAVILCVCAVGVTFTGCTEIEQVKYNVKQEADNFNVTRRLTVINSRSDKVLLELIGNFSIAVDSADNQLEVTSEVAENQFKIDYVNLNEWTTYIVEDLSGADVDKYHYEINYLPEGNIQKFTITNKE